MTFTPTQEQQDAITMAKQGGNLRLEARAGAAKTSTLVMIADEIIKPSLYLAYNKAMADEAKERFPEHVDVMTTHSLAYRHIGRQYQHKLNRPRGAYKNVCGTGGEIARHYKIKDIQLDNDKKVNAAFIGLVIKETVNCFEYSADTEITDTHIPYGHIRDLEKRNGFVKKPFIKMVVKWAKELWEERTNLRSDVLCTHDTYMKLFQLSEPQLTNYQVIYLDEGQDSNACLLDIFMKQECQKIAVGDTFQSIYMWRGSVNAMELLSYPTAQLTKSFRFGDNIAALAVQALKDRESGLCNYQVKGFEEVEDKVGYENTVDYDKPYTILFRTNAALLSEAVYLMEHTDKKINIECDIKEFVKTLESALALFQMDMKSVKHEDIIPYNTWHEMKTESKSKGELVRLIDIVERGDALHYIDVLHKHYNIPTPDITLTSAHKSKGREWEQVVLAEDFPPCYNKKGEWVGLDNQERNLLYVAVTRAKKALQYNNTMKDVLEFEGLVKRIILGSAQVYQFSDKSDMARYEALFTPRGDGACMAVDRSFEELTALLYAEGGNTVDIETMFEEGLCDENGYAYSAEDALPEIFKKAIKREIGNDEWM